MPNQTRWNSHFDCLSVIVARDLSLLNRFLSQLKIPILSPIEITIFKEYLSIMKPIAIALDILQGEENCYMDNALPVLDRLKSRLEDVSLVHASNFRKLVLEAVETRFSAFFDNTLYKIAAICHPKFKLNWIPIESEREHLKTVLQSKLSSGLESSSHSLLTASRTLTATSPTTEDFLSFDSVCETDSYELDNYLSDKRKDLAMLFDYPNILNIFIETNTTLPSRAPVERLFSQASIVLTCKRNRLKDLLFEHLLLLKVNDRTKIVATVSEQ